MKCSLLDHTAYRPAIPEPPAERLEKAAGIITEFLANGYEVGDDREISLHVASRGCRLYEERREGAPSNNDFRWAIQKMLKAQLVRLIQDEPAPPVQDEFFEWPVSNEPPTFSLRSTPKLWTRWKAKLILAIADRREGNGNASIICHHGDRGYSLDGGKPVVVTRAEHNILAAFAKSPTAMTSKKLERIVANPSQVISRLSERHDGLFAPAITLPGTKNNGGYFIRVRIQPATPPAAQ